MAILKKCTLSVHLSEHVTLSGNVTGHSNLQDGIFIYTTPIKSATIDKDKIIFKTLNTEYVVAFADFNLNALKYINYDDVFMECLNQVNPSEVVKLVLIFNYISISLKKNMEIKDISMSYVKENYSNLLLDYSIDEILDLQNKIVKAVMQTDIVYKAKLDSIKAEIKGTGSIYLDLGNNADYYFNFALYEYNDEWIVMEKPYVHLGMIQDSILFSMIQLSYFPYKASSLEFYSWVDDEEVIIHNSGVKPLRIKVPWGDGYGSTFEIPIGQCISLKKGDVKDALPEEDSELFSEIDLHDLWGKE